MVNRELDKRDRMKEEVNAPVGRLLCYYGDDSTGSTDVLEALALNGVKTALFLEPPSKEMLDERFPDLQCIGIAGISRSLSPAAMEDELRPVFQRLAEYGARVVHYKVCSTFDSSPAVGSIGKAIELAREVFAGQRFVPLLVGCPVLQRYTIFGHHFAAFGEDTHRLDRHPTMARHPVTPMPEADLALHLGGQTDLPVGHMNLFDLEGPADQVQDRLESRLQGGKEIVLFDVLDEERLQAAGALIWNESGGSGKEGLFVAGSSGVEYALLPHWRKEAILPPRSDAEHEILEDYPGLADDTALADNPGFADYTAPAAGPAAASGSVQVGDKSEAGSSSASVVPVPLKQLLVVSGSCSPVTANQLRHALNSGYAGMKVPVAELLESGLADEVMGRVYDQALQYWQQGRSVILYTSDGPDDASLPAVRHLLEERGVAPVEIGGRIGRLLGQVTRKLLTACRLKRLLVSGGDTSGYVTKELGIYALEYAASLAPGGPLCRCRSDDRLADGLEIVLKGGQVGQADFFERVRLAGRESRPI